MFLSLSLSLSHNCSGGLLIAYLPAPVVRTTYKCHPCRPASALACAALQSASPLDDVKVPGTADPARYSFAYTTSGR